MSVLSALSACHAMLPSRHLPLQHASVAGLVVLFACLLYAGPYTTFPLPLPIVDQTQAAVKSGRSAFNPKPIVATQPGIITERTVTRRIQSRPDLVPYPVLSSPLCCNLLPLPSSEHGLSRMTPCLAAPRPLHPPFSLPKPPSPQQSDIDP